MMANFQGPPPISWRAEPGFLYNGGMPYPGGLFPSAPLAMGMGVPSQMNFANPYDYGGGIYGHPLNAIGHGQVLDYPAAFPPGLPPNNIRERRVQLRNGDPGPPPPFFGARGVPLGGVFGRGYVLGEPPFIDGVGFAAPIIAPLVAQPPLVVGRGGLWGSYGGFGMNGFGGGPAGMWPYGAPGGRGPQLNGGLAPGVSYMYGKKHAYIVPMYNLPSNFQERLLALKPTETVQMDSYSAANQFTVMVNVNDTLNDVIEGLVHAGNAPADYPLGDFLLQPGKLAMTVIWDRGNGCWAKGSTYGYMTLDGDAEKSLMKYGLTGDQGPGLPGKPVFVILHKI